MAAESGDELAAQPAAEAALEQAVQQQEGEQPKPAEAAPAAAATPAAIDSWTAKAPELKAVFEKYPDLQAEIMETARGLEAAKPVLDIVSTKEEAEFAVDHANRLVTLQANWMLGAEDPDMITAAWDQTVDMFKERDAAGAEVMENGKPKLGADFVPFVTKAANTAISELLIPGLAAQIATLTEKLNGVYPNEEAKAADTEALTEAKYSKAALDYTLSLLNKQTEASPALPKLPPNATPEQIAYQEKLATERAELDLKQGKQTTASRKAATARINADVQSHYEAGINATIETQINQMKERGEYLPDFVLTDKYINPQTQQPTKVSDFGARAYLALNAKIFSNPVHSAKLKSLEAMGAAGVEARKAEVTRLTNKYLPGIIQARVKEIQDGIRSSSGKPPAVNGQVARVEPLSAGTTTPSALDAAQVRQWAVTEAQKDPSWEGMSETQREQLVISLGAKKRFGG